MDAQEILAYLDTNEAVISGKHFVYTRGGHGTAYINMRAVAHHTRFMADMGYDLAEVVKPFNVDMVVGPETLGRTLAEYTGYALGIDAAWCDIEDTDDGGKLATFSEKLNFQRLISGKRVAVVDDLLTTGASVRAVVELVTRCGGEVVVVAVVVRRTPDVEAEHCGVSELRVLADVEGFEQLTEAECRESGLCFQRIQIVLRPGHGWKYQQKHPDYEGGYA